MNPSILFPAKFRKVAYFLILLIILFGIIDVNFLHISLNNQLNTFFKDFSLGIICLALFLIQYTKYSDDDEMLMHIRLNITIFSLMVSILYLILSAIADAFIFEGDTYQISANQILFFMLLFQILQFQMKRYSLRKELKNKQ